LVDVRLALATCARLPEPDPDEAPLLEALRAAGHEAEALAWDDPGADPAAYDVVVLRATWNYHLDPDRFLAWAERVDAVTRLVNPLPVVRWNMHKRYLAELAAAGVPVVPTVWLERGQAVTARGLRAETGWDTVVVKPAISAASYETHRLSLGDEDAADGLLRRLSATRDAMVQPYLRSIEKLGERSLVWIDGELTHVVGKRPRFAGGDERAARVSGPTPAERGIVDAALRAWRSRALYARIDLLPANDGQPLLSELEMIEPSLFLVESDRAVRRLVDALGRATHSAA
jgi:hypothetical protein